MHLARAAGVQTRVFSAQTPQQLSGAPCCCSWYKPHSFPGFHMEKTELKLILEILPPHFTAVHRFAWSAPRQVQALSSPSHALLHMPVPEHTQTVLSFLRSLKETLSC